MDLFVFDIDEIKEMNPEQCKGLLMGFLIGFDFNSTVREAAEHVINDVLDEHRQSDDMCESYISFEREKKAR